jgi:repressor LexA
VLRAIEAYVQSHDRPPTLRDIVRDAHIKSLGQVVPLLKTLEQRGYLTRDPKVSRGIHLTGKTQQLLSSLEPDPERRDVPRDMKRGPGVPILGTIAAGEPLDLFEASEVEALDVGRDVRPGDPSVFALRVRGDSMIEDGILDGDFVLVRPGPTAPPEALVVAVHLLAGGGSDRGAATLKRLRFQKDRRTERVLAVLLCPANASLQPIAIPTEEWDREWQVQGMVTAVHRRYDQ